MIFSWLGIDFFLFFFFKQKTAYEMRISDWSSDVCSSDLLDAVDFRKFDIAEAQVRRARRAYFANISYLDEKIGRLLDVLRRCRLDEDTVVIFCADHGDMLGERGLWFKMSFFEGSARIPLMVAGAGLGEGRSEERRGGKERGGTWRSRGC